MGDTGAMDKKARLTGLCERAFKVWGLLRL